MEHLIEFGMFTGKVLIVVVGIIAVIIAIVSAAMRNKEVEEQISVTHLNKKLKKVTQKMKEVLLDKKELKAEAKKTKKEKKKGQRKLPSQVFVINFEGDMRASAVKQLKIEVTAILSVARSGDEVVACVESPGGVVHGYGLAASQLLRLKQKGLKLTVCVDKVAASGGYMMACTADKIISAPFAIVGSIGVLAQVPNLHRFLKKHNIDYEEITAGDYKRTISMLGEITEKGREKFTEQMENTHVLFKNFVAENRPSLEISKVATGEYWFGNDAKNLGLVDEISTSDQYLMDLCDVAEIYQVKAEPKKKLSDKLAETMSASVTQSFEKTLTFFNPNNWG